MSQPSSLRHRVDCYDAAMRAVVVGTSGSGKTVFSRALAERIGGEHIELDALNWAEGWTMRPREEFGELVRRAAAGERWVADGNYSLVRELLWPRATHVIWLNFSRAVVFGRILRRTVRRSILREQLWHGNRESLAKALFSHDSILLWSLVTFSRIRARYAAISAGGSYPHLTWL